ncbi:MAG: hypothetical protein GC168_09960 [Candidatus Hydrogenedens sp.]|nr:hypothetical protein [Candidatus Hydrogenedens sp.]
MDTNFDNDVDFLQRHGDTLVLGDDSLGRVAVAPGYQGRVMTSTCGSEGRSFGWINRALIASGETRPQFNPYGGEDRFWLGPEGGPFALYFAPGAPFEFEHWQTPPLLDTEPFVLTSSTGCEACFEREAALVNHAGTRFEFGIDRIVRVLKRRQLGFAVPDSLDCVAYESANTLSNTGANLWRKETGLLSIWMLGMFQPSTATTIVAPYRPGPEDERGPVVNDAYFGAVPPDRLRTGERAVYFRGDGLQRGKIGLSAQRALPRLGSYDADAGVLTIVEYTLPEGASDYVDSTWGEQAHPFAGDVVNAYNDGPTGPGQPPLGPFYELETSSPALALAPGEAYTHTHRTLHVTGARAALDALARETLGVSLEEIGAAFA